MTKLNKTSMLAVLAVVGAALVGGAALAHGPKDGMQGGRAGGPMGGQAFAFTEMDANGDGQLTADEFEAFKTSRATSVDTDGDGFLSADELAARAEARRAEQMEARKAAGYERLLSRADADKDGKLSVDEFLTFLEERPRGPKMADGEFPRGWDADGDGVVSAEEFETARTAMLEKFQERREHRGERGEHRGEGGEHGERGMRGAW